MTEKAKNPPLLPREDDYEVKKLRLDQIRYDGGTQMRTERRQETIDSYRVKYESAIPLPEPVVFFSGTDYWLADGFQRCEAATDAKLKTLKFRVYAGGQRQAILYACGANESHGLPRDRFAKRRVVLTCMFDGEWNQSNRWIAETCRVTHGFVNQLRDMLDEALRVEAAGGKTAVEWAREHCQNPRAKPGEAQWLPAWSRPRPAEPPIDVPENFRPDRQHSPPTSEGEVDTYPVESDARHDGSESGPPAEDAYRTGRDGKRRKVKQKERRPASVEAFDAFGTDDKPADDAEQSGTTAIGEPLNELTAPAFAQLGEFRELHRTLTDVMKRVDVLYETGAGCFIPLQELKIQLENCRAWIYQSRPHAHCQNCGGEGCRDCRQSGFVSKAKYDQDQKLAKQGAAA